MSCEVFSGVTSITISAQPTLVQTTAPLGGQTLCLGQNIDTITFEYGGSATGIRLINLPNGLSSVTDAAAKTITVTGSPTGTGFVRVEIEGTTCEIIRLDHNIIVTSAPERPDYILIDNAPGGTDPIPIITGQDGSYLAEYLLSLDYEVHGIQVHLLKQYLTRGTFGIELLSQKLLNLQQTNEVLGNELQMLQTKLQKQRVLIQ